jgi:hypothetical protein
MTANRARPHRYDPDPRSTVRVPPCAVCAQTRAYRSHQPLWWRVLHPSAKWR